MDRLVGRGADNYLSPEWPDGNFAETLPSPHRMGNLDNISFA